MLVIKVWLAVGGAGNSVLSVFLEVVGLHAVIRITKPVRYVFILIDPCIAAACSFE
ncbi:hypothetical protein ACFLTX_01930 [Chloroflexota bacterium]